MGDHRCAGRGIGGAAVRALNHGILRVIEDHGAVLQRIRLAVVRLECEPSVDEVFAIGVGIGFRLFQLLKLAAVHGDVVGQRVACVLIDEKLGDVSGVGLAVRRHHRVQRNAGGQRRGSVGDAFDLNAEKRIAPVAVGVLAPHPCEHHLLIGLVLDVLECFRCRKISFRNRSSLFPGMSRQRESECSVGSFQIVKRYRACTAGACNIASCYQHAPVARNSRRAVRHYDLIDRCSFRIGRHRSGVLHFIRRAVHRDGDGTAAAAVVGFDRQGDGLLVSLHRDVLRCRSGGGGVSLCGERCGGQKPENHQRGQQKGQ